MTANSDMPPLPKQSQCDPKVRGCVSTAAYIIGSKWTPELIYVLANGIHRFSEIQKEIGVNPRTLSARLDDLETTGIVTKQQYQEVPPRIEYTLTDKGRDLLPVLETMVEWGDKYR
jgi:DNA-binding HxlR family transcriptional regulator